MSDTHRDSGAGALLRAARQKQGLHIAALAASIKVAPAKLEALESGRYDELPDATFARALAQSVCRALKIDAQPVLALLPSGAAAALDKVDRGLNAPFRERPTRTTPAEWLAPRQPVLWLALLLLVAAAAFALLPGSWTAGWIPSAGEAGSGAVANTGTRTEQITPPGTTSAVSQAAPPAVPASAPLDAPLAAMSPVPGAAASAAAGIAAPIAADAGARLTAREATWVHVTDGSGQVLLSRTLQAGEVADLAGPRPLNLRIGNVRGTELVDRGQAIELASRTRDNVLNLELP
jgi:cytoskeleton protein RodZ